MKMSFSDTDQAKWKKVLVTEFMSSDESGDEDGHPVFIVKKLPWRSERVSNFLNTLMLLGRLKKPNKQTVKLSHVFPKIWCLQGLHLMAFQVGH